MRLKYTLPMLLLCLSLGINVGLGTYYIRQWLAPIPQYKTPEQRLQTYLQYLPADSRAAYQTRIAEQLGTLLVLQKELRQERQKAADLLIEKDINKDALKTSFEKIRDKGQEINRIYQEALIDIAATLPENQRQQAHDFMVNMIRRETSPSQ